eukprot:8997268-Prorocentrum_lima.AAC.1
MTSSLVGSEMCIRDSAWPVAWFGVVWCGVVLRCVVCCGVVWCGVVAVSYTHLTLADDMQCVDLG